jgi:hypothetical protein
MIKFVKSQKTGQYVEIGPNDMDYNTPFAFTEDELRAEKKAISEALDMVDSVRLKEFLFNYTNKITTDYTTPLNQLDIGDF